MKKNDSDVKKNFLRSLIKEEIKKIMSDKKILKEFQEIISDDTIKIDLSTVSEKDFQDYLKMQSDAVKELSPSAKIKWRYTTEGDKKIAIVKIYM